MPHVNNLKDKPKKSNVRGRVITKKVGKRKQRHKLRSKKR